MLKGKTNMKPTYNHFFQFGDHIRLTQSIDTARFAQDLEEFDNDWNQYNEFKPQIRREGLCILNEDGINKRGPAISSILEWNKTYGTSWSEEDFVVPTPVYHKSIDMQNLLGPILPYICRTHILKIKPGGYFPPHRDAYYRGGIESETFRLLMPLYNTSSPWFRFMVEDATLPWTNGDLYAVNTQKEHTLFNTSIDKDSYWIVINAKVCEEMFNYVTSNLSIR